VTVSSCILPISDETDADRRRGILDNDALSLDLVSAHAGDRTLTEAEKHRLDELKHARGLRFFSDLLYSITHQYFPPEAAEKLWAEILKHKAALSKVLGRNVRIAVATLDYLSNITANMDSATLVGEANIEEIINLSFRDGLTGLFNHTYFYQQIDFEVKRYLRYGAIVSLILIDIDDFKLVNDTFGHREGDRILATMGKTFFLTERDSDICCRYGGEEFAVILPLTDIQEAAVIADRLNSELQETLPDGSTVTVSIGVATCGDGTKTYRDIVERADEALYQAKRSGKNRVEVASCPDGY
jgi:diguanylate cyclase (GGDEF)-like protein